MRTQLNYGQLIESIDDNGYVLLAREQFAFCRRFLVPLIREFSFTKVLAVQLKPHRTEDALTNSLSSRYGVLPFPPHTDFSTEVIPPKYIILACPVLRNANTFIYDSLPQAAQNKYICKKALFRVHRVKDSFSSTFLTERSGRPLVRFNADTMSPLNDAATEISKKISLHWQPTAVVNWSRISAAIIDNWRCLHARGAIQGTPVGWIRRVGIWSNQ
jgi:alpha-ketoglutarate-dependent taurine dioxygenase